MSVVWRYRMEPEGEGTRLRESYKLATPIPRFADWLAGLVFGMKDRSNELQES